MKKAKFTLALLASLIAVGTAFKPALAQTEPNQELTAIDILLNPDAAMLAKAKHANASLRQNYPAGFALGAEHTPHISVIHMFVKTADLDKVADVVGKLASSERFTEFELKATHYIDLPYGKDLDLTAMAIQPPPALVRFQQKLIDAVAPFNVKDGTAAAFVPNADGTPVNQATVDYVKNFLKTETGDKFIPHVTVGLGKKDFVNAMKTKPFNTFAFKPVTISIFHLGDFGTARTRLWTNDSLPSWNEGPTKSAILQFVKDVTQRGGPRYVPPEQRIATFDNDGTLWCEQPVVQVAYALHQMKQMAPKHPEWKGKQPFQAAIDGNEKYFVDDLMAGGHAIFEVIQLTHAGMSVEQFDRNVRTFFKSARHPKYKVPFTQIGYVPMVELLQYLRANGFKTYICSGGGIDFMRVIAPEMYGIVPENVIGSNARNVFQEVDGNWQLMKTAEDLFNNDKSGKPVGIDLHIGRIPIFSAGNVRTGGDIAHLTYCRSNNLPSLQLLLNHDDADREYAYSEKDNASLNAAKKQGWQVVSIKNDWKRVFSFQTKSEE